MSNALWAALAGGVLAAMAVNDLIRGATGYRRVTITRARHGPLYWAWLAILALLSLTAFAAAIRLW